MLGYESERRLKTLLVSIGDMEQSNEISRQRLCQLRSMVPAALFQRIDRDMNDRINAREIQDFLRENGISSISASIEDCDQLVKFFDSDDDGRLSFNE